MIPPDRSGSRPNPYWRKEEWDLPGGLVLVRLIDTLGLISTQYILRSRDTERGTDREIFDMLLKMKESVGKSPT